MSMPVPIKKSKYDGVHNQQLIRMLEYAERSLAEKDQEIEKLNIMYDRLIESLNSKANLIDSLAQQRNELAHMLSIYRAEKYPTEENIRIRDKYEKDRPSWAMFY